MEAVIFVGLQGAGKTTFYKERFFATHLRLSLDMLKTRHRERRLLQACIETRQPFVVDNTNPTRAERQVYIGAAKESGFRVVGYYFRSLVEDCMRRNEGRPAGRLSWRQDVLEADLATYASRDIRHITSFAVYVDADNRRRYGEPEFIREYGEVLGELRRQG